MNRAMETFDVAIIGAGLAGLQCARLLGQRGLRVLLADRKPALIQKVHTTGIFVRRTLEDFDLPEDCLGPVIRHVSLYSPAHRVVHLESKNDEFRIGRMGPLYQRLLNQSLHYGVQWLPSANYLDSIQVGGNSIVRFKLDGGVKSISTRFLIGGDGVCSRVARDLQLDRNRLWITGVEDVYSEVHISGPPRLFAFLNPKLAPGYIAWIAYDGEEAHVGVAGYPNQFDPVSSLKTFQAQITDIVDLRSAQLVERRGGRIPVGGVLPRIANSRGLLIGDAAGAVSPLTAGGLDPCMRLSTLAANVTTEFLNHGNSAVFDNYSGQIFRSKFTSRMWARKIVSKVRSEALTELACATLKLPMMKLFAAQVFFGRGSFPDIELNLTAEANPLKESGT